MVLCDLALQTFLFCCRYVLGDLEIAYRQIVPGVELLCQLNPFSDVKYSSNEAEIVIFFLLGALSDLGKI